MAFQYAYRIVGGVVNDLRFVKDDYVLAPDEIGGEGFALPDVATLAPPLPPRPPKPTLEDVIAALPANLQQAIQAAMQARLARMAQ